MDTSETYIKMSDYEEIQSQWLNHDTTGDFAYTKNHIKEYNGFWELTPGIRIVGNDGEYDLTITDSREIERTGAIWLPRQDQIQEMIKGISKKYDSFIVQIKNIYDYLFATDISTGFHYHSMEQLWLSFYMKEKHNKVWRDGKWIKSY